MKTATFFGAAVGLATTAWMLAEYALGLHADPAGPGRWTGFLALGFPVIGAHRLAVRCAWRSWRQALRDGVVFGLAGGLVGGAGIYLYFAVLHPGFSAGGRPVSPFAQAASGFAGALVLGLLLTVIMHARSIFKRGSHA